MVGRRLPSRRRCGLFPAPVWQLKPGGARLGLLSHQLLPVLLLTSWLGCARGCWRRHCAAVVAGHAAAAGCELYRRRAV